MKNWLRTAKFYKMLFYSCVLFYTLLYYLRTSEYGYWYPLRVTLQLR